MESFVSDAEYRKNPRMRA